MDNKIEVMKYLRREFGIGLKAPLPENDCVSCQDFHRGIGVSHNHCDNRHPYNSDGDSRANGHGSVDGVFQNCPFRTPIPNEWVVGKSRADGQKLGGK
jgi:hypothetical protein